MVADGGQLTEPITYTKQLSSHKKPHEVKRVIRSQNNPHALLNFPTGQQHLPGQRKPLTTHQPDQQRALKPNKSAISLHQHTGKEIQAQQKAAVTTREHLANAPRAGAQHK